MQAPVQQRAKAETFAGARDTSFLSVSDTQRLADLNAQLSYTAERSGFYGARLGKYPRLASFSQIGELPFTCAVDITENYGSMLCVPASDVRRVVSVESSGTTGKRKRLYFSEGDIERTISFFSKGMRWICGEGDKVGIFMPCGTPDGIGQLLAEGLRRIRVRPLCFGLIHSVKEASLQLAGEKPDVLVGVPWQIRLLALTCPHLCPRAVLLSADYVPESMYGLLESIWGCTVVSHFGMTETGYGCALESAEHTGLYLRKDEFFAEAIDPDTGERKPDGEMGELVLTTLRREAMPLIRYRTGDLVRLSDSGSRILRVYGRVGISPAVYRLQEALCMLRDLFDYTFVDTPNAGAKIIAEMSDAAEADTEEQIRQIVSRIYKINAEKVQIGIKTVHPQDAIMFSTGKRT